MSFLNHYSYRTKMFTILGGFVISFLVLMIVSIFQTTSAIEITRIETSKLKIGGELFKKFDNIKDLKADILPPPLFLIEVESFLFELLITNNPETIQYKLEWYQNYKSIYNERKALWKEVLPEDEMKNEFFNNSLPIAEEMFWIIDNEFLPLYKTNKLDQCYKMMKNIIIPKFEQHKTSIEKVALYAEKESVELVEHSKELEHEIYNKIQETNSSSFTWTAIIAGLVLVIFLSIAIVISNNIAKNLNFSRKRLMDFSNGIF